MSHLDREECVIFNWYDLLSIRSWGSSRGSSGRYAAAISHR